MKLLLKLTLREAWYHRSRVFLAVLATVACACMIVWLVGAIDLMMAQVADDGENFLGEYQFVVLPERNNTPGKHMKGNTSRQGSEESRGRGSGGRLRRMGFPPFVIDELRNDPFVQRIDPAWQSSCSLIRPSDDVQPKEDDPLNFPADMRIPTRSPSLIALDVKDCPFDLKQGRWFSDLSAVNDESVLEGVLGTGIANYVGSDRAPIKSGPVRVGDEMIVKIGDRKHRIKIVGLVEQKMSTVPRRPGAGPGGPNPAQASLFVSMNTAEKLTEKPRQTDFLYLKLRDGTETKSFAEKWLATHEGELENSPIKLRFIDAEEIQEALNAAAAQGNRGTGVLMGVNMITILFFATVAAVFIVFTTLSMGVGERTRTFAMLRTIGMRQGGVAALVFGESFVLCLLGIGGGLFVGWLLLQSSLWLNPALRESGALVLLSWKTVGVTALCVFIGSMLATIVPAWRATRISPLEGMDRGYASDVSKRKFYLAGLIGCLFLLVDPLIVFGPGLTSDLRKSFYYILGLPTLVIGWLLVVPAVILIIEKLFSIPVAALLRIRKELLASQLSSNLWRTLGTTISICIGLGLYTMFEIWGYSMLVPYTPSEKTPDTLVVMLPTGIPFDEVENARKLHGVDRDRFLLLDIEQPKFSQRQFDSKQFGDLWRSATNVVLFGMDPKKAFLPGLKGEKPLIELEFLQGTIEDAVEKMSEPGGRYCVVPDSFATRVNLKVGDKLELVVPEDLVDPQRMGSRRNFGGPDGTDRPDAGEAERARQRVDTQIKTTVIPEKVLEYEVCGIVSFPGSIWISKTAGVRSRHGRTACIAFAPAETVRKDFEIKDAAFFWFDRTPGTTKEQVEKEFTDFHEKVGSRVAGLRYRQGLGMPFGSRVGASSEIRVSTTESITAGVTSRSTQVIQSTAKMPLVILAISSIGMMGTMAASVRTRRYQLGVLRSLGVTRSGLIRLILGEALLIAVASIILSLGFGMLTAWCSAGLAKYVSIFGATVAGFVLPWKYLVIGFGMALGLCFLAAIGPAFIASRQEPSRLLQER